MAVKADRSHPVKRVSQSEVILCIHEKKLGTKVKNVDQSILLSAQNNFVKPDSYYLCPSYTRLHILLYFSASTIVNALYAGIRSAFKGLQMVFNFHRHKKELTFILC